MKERKKYIDVAKFMGVFLVVYGHAGLNFTKVRMTLAAFHMPLFFVLYGFCSSQAPLGEKEISSFLGKRVKALLVPYILWAMIYAPSISVKFWKNVFYGSNKSLGRADTNMVLWFLPCMFLASVILKVLYCGFSYLDKYVNLYVSRIAAAGILIILGRYFGRPYPDKIGCWFSFDVALIGCVFMIFGGLPVVRSCMERIHQAWPIWLKFLTGILGLAATGGLAILNSANFKVRSKPCVVMALGRYGNYAVFFAAALLGSVSVLLLAMVFENVRIFDFLGRYSLVIMAVHHILFTYVQPWCSRLKEIAYADYIYPAVVAAICMVLCIPICMIIRWGCSPLNGDRNEKQRQAVR